jgi:hypothetical protein
VLRDFKNKFVMDNFGKQLRSGCMKAEYEEVEAKGK